MGKGLKNDPDTQIPRFLDLVSDRGRQVAHCTECQSEFSDSQPQKLTIHLL